MSRDQPDGAIWPKSFGPQAHHCNAFAVCWLAVEDRAVGRLSKFAAERQPGAT
jgi:hypothetical protein